MDSTPFTTGVVSPKPLPRARDQISQLVEQIRSDLHEGASLNQSASINGVARSTTQVWMRNRSRLEQQGGLAPAMAGATGWATGAGNWGQPAMFSSTINWRLR